MARKRNPTIVTCRVGARMRPAKRRTSRRTPRNRVKACDGPFLGAWLSLTCDNRTLELRVGAAVGHYAGGKWSPSSVSQ